MFSLSNNKKRHVYETAPAFTLVNHFRSCFDKFDYYPNQPNKEVCQNK